jgi:hypothetical protein
LAAAAAQHLHTLTLLNVDVTDAVMHHLARHCPSLAHLAVGRSQDNAFCSFISDAGLAVVAASCRRLTSLCLFRCYSCTDAGLREVARQQGLQLTALVLHSCPQVSSDGVCVTRPAGSRRCVCDADRVCARDCPHIMHNAPHTTHTPATRGLRHRHKITAPGLVRFIEATPSLRELDVLLPESSPGGAAVNFDTCFALAAHCSNLQVCMVARARFIKTGGAAHTCTAAAAAGTCTSGTRTLPPHACRCAHCSKNTHRCCA